MLIKDYANILKREFKGYNGKKFGKDVMAGVTVAAVALPLALAFGVSSGEPLPQVLSRQSSRDLLSARFPARLIR